MRKKIAIVLACIVTVGLVAPWALAESTDDVLNKPISLNLKGARANELFPLFAQLVGAELDLAYETDEAVDLVFNGITARTGLNAFCESIGCDWRLIDGTPRVLRFSSPETFRLDKLSLAEEKRISIDLKEATAGEVLELTATLLDVELVLEGGSLSTKSLTIVRDRTTVSDFLDDVCADIGCNWEIVDGGPVKLHVW